MVEILVYKTPEEAKQQLEKYEQDNREAFEFVKPQGEDRSERLKRQTYFFVAELAAYTDNAPATYYFETVAFPFLGHTNLCADIQSLVQGVKAAVKCQTPKNIETILYTIENHDEENKEMKKNAKEHREVAENLHPDGAYGVSKKELEAFLQEFEKFEATEVRGLTEHERKEFVRLYGGK